MAFRISFCGAASSRKSTVCALLESMLKQKVIRVDTSKEYAREYINSIGVPQQLYEQLIIDRNQETRDMAMDAAVDIFLTDYPVVNSYIFSKRMLQKLMDKEDRKTMTFAEHKFLEEAHSFTIRRLAWFDLIVVFPPDKLVQDGTRTENEKDQKDIFKSIIGFLHAENHPYIEVTGTVEERAEQILKYLVDKGIIPEGGGDVDA